MSDREARMLALLRKMSEAKDGSVILRNYMGIDEEGREELHTAELLVDRGLANWRSESMLRITAQGYDRLERDERERELAQRPPSDAAARTLLTVCRKLDLKPGNPLPGQPIWHQTVGAQRLTQSEFDAGINRAVELGWFEKAADGNHVLTEAGAAIGESP